jgi:heme/copper-type cytochrome/quinol oxidase subunit 3
MAEAGQEALVSTISIDRLPPETRDHPPLVMELDTRRGTAGMWLFIATEATLFVILFWAYFYLAEGGWTWPHEKPPKLHYAIPMSIILWSSSGVTYWAEKQVKARRYARGRMGGMLTIAMGIAFLVLSAFEYKEHLQELTPMTNVYGSIFYTITTFHVAHLILGLSMLVFALILPRLEPVDRPPHRPFHNAALYWHFVDFVWLWIMIFLYFAPNLR